jgi:hypothetical protein
MPAQFRYAAHTPLDRKIGSPHLNFFCWLPRPSKKSSVAENGLFQQYWSKPEIRPSKTSTIRVVGDGAKGKLSIIPHSGVQRHWQSRRAARFYNFSLQP